MKQLLRHSKLTVLAAVLSISGLALAVTVAPAAHAGSMPSITATGGTFAFSVTGTGFTPLHKVFIRARVYNPILKKWTFDNKDTITADGSGGISVTMSSTPGTVRVYAYDYASKTWSNRSVVTVSRVIIPPTPTPPY